MSKENILVVDDEAEIRDILEKYLLKEGMNVTKVDSGEAALAELQHKTFDLMILDVMMGGIDGFEVLRKIRANNESLHVIMLSARDEDYDKVLGLGLGADDYLTKPFSRNEFVARVKSQLRRLYLNKTQEPDSTQDIVDYGIFSIDKKQYQVYKNGNEIKFSAREYKLFCFLIENHGRVFTKIQIYDNVWEDSYFDDNTLMVYIRHVREKIEDTPNKPEYIVTVRGIGYKFSLGRSK